MRPLLSRLRKVGTEGDGAGKRRLCMDPSCGLIRMALLSPAVHGLRDLRRACPLDKVRKGLGVNRGCAFVLAAPGEVARALERAVETIAAEDCEA